MYSTRSAPRHYWGQCEGFWSLQIRKWGQANPNHSYFVDVKYFQSASLNTLIEYESMNDQYWSWFGYSKTLGASNQYAEKAFMKMWIDSFAPKNLKVQDRKNIRLCIVFLMFRWRGLDVLTERCTDHLRFNISNGHLWTMDEAERCQWLITQAEKVIRQADFDNGGNLLVITKYTVASPAMIQLTHMADIANPLCAGFHITHAA